MRIFCAITCDPSNSLFMNVRHLDPDNISIDTVDVYFANYYANQLYNSCKDIKAQDSHGCSKVVNTYFCGQFDGNYDQCSGQQWLRILGTPQPLLQIPFTLYFMFTSDSSGHDLPTNMSARNGTLLKCSDPVDGVTCSCSDCPAACLHTLPGKVSVNISIPAVGVFVGMIGFVIYNAVFVFILVVLLPPATAKKDTNLSSNGVAHESYFSACNNGKVNSCISQLFSWWGHVTVDYWYLIIPMVLIMVFACSTGLMFYEVMTDTVETWSPFNPGGRAQKEKEYFNQHFNGSYHASQIIITAPNIPGFTFNNSVHYTIRYNASGMFLQYILNEVSVLLIPGTNIHIALQIWHMQNDVINLNATYKDNDGTEVMFTLDDICLKPFAADNKNCVIYSVLNYFQNSYELLNREVKYVFTVRSNSSYHLLYCTR